MNRRTGSPLHLSRRALRQGLGAAVLALVLLAPPCALVFQFALAFANDPGQAREIFSPRTARLLAQSLGEAAAVALTGTLLAIPAASALWQAPGSAQKRLRWFFMALAPLPPTLHALAWITAGSWAADLAQAAGLFAPSLRGWGWLIWVQSMALAPLAVGLTLLGLQRLPAGLWEAACLFSSPWRAFWKVAIPHSAPYLLAAAGLLFLLSLTDFSLAATFQVNVYAFEIFTTFSAFHDAGRTLLVALPLCAATLPAALLTGAQLRRILAPGPAGQAARPRFTWPFAWEMLQKAAILILLLQVGVPLGALLLTAGPPTAFAASVAGAGDELFNSTRISLLAALAGLPLALLAAQILAGAGRAAWAGWLGLAFLLALPAPLAGAGLIAVWNHPGWPVYGTLLMPLHALLARWTPYAALLVLAQLRHIDPLLLEAEQVFHTGWLRAWLRVRLPLLSPGLLAGAFLILTLSLGELGATLLVLPPGMQTLAVRLYNYLHYGAAQQVSALALLTALTGLTLGLAFAACFHWISPARRSAP